MAAQLSPYRLGKARETYNFFNIFNAISWNLLVGIIITLFALRLGAASTFIGLMGSTFYFALFLLPVGKIISRRFSIIGIFSFTWIARSLCMILAVAAPFVDYAGHRNTALFLIMLGVLLFHIFRGIGMIGNNPVLSLLASGPDRGSYMTQIQIINSSIGMFGSFLVAMVLGMDPPVFVFSILLSIGVITGIISGCLIRKVPEPPRHKDGQEMKLINIFKEALSQDFLRHFMVILFLVVLVSGVTRTFVVVYAREVFKHNDGLISLYAVFGGLGYLMAGLIVKFLVDRLGAKPLFIVSVILGLVSLIPAVFFPLSALDNVTGTILFLVFLFFMLNFGFLGSEGIAQTYFLGLIPPEKILNMGILYFFILGIAGASGTFLAGLLIDLLFFIGISPFIAFKILFIIMIAFTILALSMQGKMKSLGSLPLTDALEVIFSFRDLRAISLLDKLNKAEDSREEELLLGALHNTPSHLATDGLLERARSPKLATRLEAIRALEKQHRLSKHAEKALMDDMINNPFTTAYISARILGNHHCAAAIPKLRELSGSEDYMLAGESIIALSKMKDEEFRASIEKNILETNNPRLKIMGAEALGIYHNNESIPVLLDILRSKNPPPYLRDEVILAIAAIIDTQKKFYKILARYSADKSLASALAMDEVEAALEFVKTALNKKKAKEKASVIASSAEDFQNSVSNYIRKNNGEDFSRWILELPEHYSKPAGRAAANSHSGEHSRSENIVKNVFSKTVIDDDLSADDCLRLLIINWAAQRLRIRAAMIK
ncbi:MAG: MFS transporter [Treponema sp.]|nr:MFS transporter [Treponema sp.]